MRTTHFPPSTIARTAKIPSVVVYEKVTGLAASICRPASTGAISLSSPTICAAVRGDLVTARAPPLSSSFACSPSSSARASALLLIITVRRRSSCAISGQLADACDVGAVHEAHLLAPEHRDEALAVAVEEIQKAGLLTALLERHEAADRRAVGERDLHAHRPVRHIRDLLVL